MKLRSHPYQRGCQLCIAEYQQHSRREVSRWTRVDSIRSYCLLLAAMLVACAVLVASVVFEGRLP